MTNCNMYFNDKLSFIITCLFNTLNTIADTICLPVITGRLKEKYKNSCVSCFINLTKHFKKKCKVRQVTIILQRVSFCSCLPWRAWKRSIFSLTFNVLNDLCRL